MAKLTEDVRWLVGKAKPEWVAVVFSVVSVGVALVALALNWFENKETTDVHLTPAASINSLGSTPAGYAVRISLVNNSLRPVIITSMNLTWKGKKVAPIRTFLPGSTTDAAALGDRPLFDGRSLPFALESRGAETVTGFADFSVAEQEARLGEEGTLLELAEDFCEEVEPIGTAPAAGAEGLRRSSSSLGLEVESDPGERQEVEATLSQPTEAPNVWTVDMAGGRRHPTGVKFWLPTSSPSAFRFVTAKIWRRNGGLEHAGSLPVAGGNPARFNFSALPDGSYRIALFRRDQILAIAAFTVPLPKHSRQVFPTRAQEANGQCLEIEGRKDVFTHTLSSSAN